MDSDASPRASGLKRMVSGSRLARVLRYPDFRLLWIGAFVSFTGSWVEKVAQGHFVYELTKDESKLAFVSFAWSFPVLVLGLFTGTLADQLDKRLVLVWTQALFGILACILAVATYFGFVQYWHIVVIAFLNGVISTIEMPTRQSVVSRVVPPEELATAVPVNAMTFNIARIFGPAIGGLTLALFGVAACYLLNGISFFALIWASLAIKSNLKSTEVGVGFHRDIIFEGALYTLRDHRLRALFLLESATAIFGLAYIPLLPAFVQDILTTADPKHGLGFAYTAVGIGALAGLLWVTHLADSPRKGTIIRASMLVIGLGLLLVSVLKIPWIAYLVFGVVGMASIMQLNTTNALFQTLAPERLRGRVIAMHIWALNGLSPFGVLFFGWLANMTRTAKHLPTWLPSVGVPLAFQVGGVLMLIGAAAAFLSKRGLANLIPSSA